MIRAAQSAGSGRLTPPSFLSSDSETSPETSTFQLPIARARRNSPDVSLPRTAANPKLCGLKNNFPPDDHKSVFPLLTVSPLTGAASSVTKSSYCQPGANLSSPNELSSNKTDFGEKRSRSDLIS